MKVTDAQQTAIRNLLTQEKLPVAAIDHGIRELLDSTTARDQIGFARFMAKQWRAHVPTPERDSNLHPCRPCLGTGWEETHEGATAGGALIVPGGRYQPAMRRCNRCHGTKYVMEPPGPEQERITLGEFLARNPGFEWGVTQPGPPEALLALPREEPSASAAARAGETLLLP